MILKLTTQETLDLQELLFKVPLTTQVERLKEILHDAIVTQLKDPQEWALEATKSIQG